MSERRVLLRPLAAEDVTQIVATIAADNPSAAVRFIDAVEQDLAALLVFPRLGRARAFRSPQLSGVRSRPVSGFRSWLIFYRVLPDAIDVVRILHGARELTSALGERRR